MMHKVLILDANQRSALAAIRSLGKKAVPTIVADVTKETLAGASKYCAESMIYPSPYTNPEDFIDTLRDMAAKKSIGVIFPMTEISTYLLLKCRSLFEGINIPLASFESFEQLNNKWKLFELAQQLGIHAPKTYFVKNLRTFYDSDFQTSLSLLKFPVVLKPYRSKILSHGKWISASVRYANSKIELECLVNKILTFNSHPFLIQEYIRGEGRGLFALYEQGNPVIFFAHRRLREKPPSGGVSVLSESVGIDSYMRKITENLLGPLQWHGIAMVEFKIAQDGTPYLMEVNARFWGSLQLAIDAGVDFPWLLYQLAVGAPMDIVYNYKTGIRSRWLLGDLDCLYLRMFKQEHTVGNSHNEKLSGILQFLRFFAKNTKYEVNRWDDLKPFYFELKNHFKK